MQGVWYRASAQQRARELGLVGQALNLPDGRVEVIACGTEEALRQFIDWLWQGPEQARVSGVRCEQLPPQEFSDFSAG